MSGILKIYSRRIPQCIRILKHLEVGATEIPLKHAGGVFSRNLSILSNEGCALNLKSKNICTCTERYFRASVTLFDVRVVKVPPFADSVSEGDVRWEKKKGDQVAEDEVVLEIETDKTSVPVPAPGSGTIVDTFVENGATVKAGQDLFSIDVTGQAPTKSAPQPAAAAPPPAAAAPPPPAAAPKAAPPPAAAPPAAAPKPPPAAAAPRPSAPMTSIPVAAIRHAQAIEAATVKLPPQDPTKEITGTRTEQRIKMSRMRLKIAERLKQAQNTNAMLTTINEIDMSNIIDFRNTNKEAFQKKYGIKLGFMSFFLKASAYALQDQPVVNAVIDGTDILYRDYVDISVAVATPKGLVVPIIRNVERMSYADIELALNAMSEKARKGNLAVEDMDGGTFTVSNGGVFGSLMGTPIINPPQSAILGMHKTQERPVVVKGQVVVRPMMYVALTYDHRLIDGREAVLFLRKIKDAVEDPRIILAGL
ncbi:dihydrolipoyllysine-residue succinyltransferase component of 2-oxoglutarate dehydrogenase complex, mitochondrial [Coccinella septempunctata]|uniref:dihydrolipoyllysine-residue succinyltransferase component of 2-oxoglutarate dehydrogenase complex, mitochondrial n=1 Tax=Coccinella septempunctata TaxID=41139 RepID=UPI001D065739|nr:dihydrolipoyllysine-residue succinyltransferase component of 2-oxoglutarate dehydrogenase complex, mitochondrial [Coccinella septempunctata]